MVALVIVLVCCFSSDIRNDRPKHIMAMATMSTVSLIIVAAVENSKVRYAFLAFGRALIEDIRKDFANFRTQGLLGSGVAVL